MAFQSSSVQSVTTATIQTIYNVTIALADTEQSLALSTNIKGYIVKTRGLGVLKLTHVATESGTKYITIPKTGVYTDEHKYLNLTLYFQSPTVGEIVEVITWE